MSKLTKYIKRGIKYVMSGEPVLKVSPKVVSLGPTELLKGHSVLITGGTSGIGLAIAKACLLAGANVVITSRNENRAVKAVESIKKETSCENIYGTSFDLNEAESFSDKIQQVNKLLSSHKVDMLVNNAGIGTSNETDSIKDFDIVLQNNLRGTYFLSIAFAEYLQKNEMKGHILNVASSSSLRPATTPYALSKWGIKGLTLGLAKKYIKSGIVVNGIAPGPTATPMLNRTSEEISNPRNPIGRLVMPEEIAYMSIILLSAIGDSIIGDIVYMTGGAGLITFDDVDY